MSYATVPTAKQLKFIIYALGITPDNDAHPWTPSRNYALTKLNEPNVQKSLYRKTEGDQLYVQIQTPNGVVTPWIAVPPEYRSLF